MLQHHKFFFPVELEDTPDMLELRKELAGVSYTGFKALHDDGLDLISQIGLIDYITPTAGAVMGATQRDTSGVYADLEEEEEIYGGSTIF